MMNLFSRRGLNSPRTWLARGSLIACMITSSSALSDTLLYSDHDPLGGMRPQFVNDVWIPEIEKLSDGALTVKPFYGGALLGSKEVLTGVGQGVADLGFVFPGHYPERLIAHTIFPLFPRGPEKYEDMAWFYHQVYDRVPAFREELEAAGVVPLMVTAGLPGVFAATYPIDSLADLEGEKWRAGGKWPLKYLDNSGAVPVSVPWSDVYVGLQTGTIDGVFTNYDGISAMKFDEAAQNLLISKELWFAVPFVHVANKQKFDNLSEADQKTLRDASAAAEQQFGSLYDTVFEQIRKSEEDAGAIVTEMSPEDLNAWENKDALVGLQQQWVDEAKASGLKNADEVMGQVREIYAEAMQR